MPYEVGDTVLITSDPYILTINEREQYLGTIMTIAEVNDSGFTYGDNEIWYEMEEDDNVWVWTDELIVGKVVLQKKETIKSTYLPII